MFIIFGIHFDCEIEVMEVESQADVKRVVHEYIKERKKGLFILLTVLTSTSCYKVKQDF